MYQVWSLGGNLADESRVPFSNFLRAQAGKLVPNLPATGDVYEYTINGADQTWMPWNQKV
jgi:hypothetical protein